MPRQDERRARIAHRGVSLVLVIAGVLLVVRAELRAARAQAPKAAPRSDAQSARIAALTSSPNSSTDMA